MKNLGKCGAASGVILSALLAIGGAQAAVPSVHDWVVRVNEGRVSDAILAYEVADTDNQPLNFTCEEGGNRIFAGLTGYEADLRSILLVAGNEQLRLSGTSEPDEIPHFTSEEIAGTSAFFRSFAKNGALRLTVNGRALDMKATAQGKDAIARFVAFCTK